MEPAVEAAEQWVALTAHPDYDIQATYPHLIRKRANGCIIALSPHNDCYLRCKLNGRSYQHHRVVAVQFIPNPQNLPEIDHINHQRDDNHINNLRWVSRRDNSRNMSSVRDTQYVFDPELPAEAIVVEEHAGHTFLQ